MPTKFKDLQRKLSSRPEPEEEDSLAKTFARRLADDGAGTPAFNPVLNKPIKAKEEEAPASEVVPSPAETVAATPPAIKDPSKPAKPTASSPDATGPKADKIKTRIEGYKEQVAALPKTDQQFFKDRLDNLETQLKASENELDRRELVEKLAQAVTQLGAGLYGMKTGADLSGLKFSTTDWAKKYDQALTKFKLGVDAVKDERDRFDRASQFQETVRQQELTRGQQADQFDRQLGVQQEGNRIKKELAAGKAAKKSDTEKVKYESALREEWSKNPVTKDTEKVVTSYRKIQKAAENPSAAGDLALIFGYMKMLDPTSVVREGEQASAQNAAGVPGQVQNLYNKLLSGERLNTDQREDFVKQAQGQLAAQLETQEVIDRRYKALADKNEIDFTNVIDTSFQGMVPKDTKVVNGVTYEKVAGGWRKAQ